MKMTINMKPFVCLFRATPPQTGQQDAEGALATYWSLPPEQLLSALHAMASGLNPADVEPRLKQYGLNALEARRQATALELFLSQFKSPLVLILMGAAIVSAILGSGQTPSLCLL
jgi:Mg2+-importing ATPase